MAGMPTLLRHFRTERQVTKRGTIKFFCADTQGKINLAIGFPSCMQRLKRHIYNQEGYRKHIFPRWSKVQNNSRNKKFALPTMRRWTRVTEEQQQTMECFSVYEGLITTGTRSKNGPADAATTPPKSAHLPPDRNRDFRSAAGIGRDCTKSAQQTRQSRIITENKTDEGVKNKLQTIFTTSA